MANIFISYSRKDREIARLLAEFLDGRGYSVWWDHDLHAGENYRRQIKVQLEGANAAIVIWSPNAKDSDWVNDEALAALRAGKLISTHTADFEPYNDTPYGFGGQHMVPVVAHEEIARAVQALLVNSNEAAAKGAAGAKVTRGGEPRIVSLVFTDLAGRAHRMSVPVQQFTEDAVSSGRIRIDLSGQPGWPRNAPSQVVLVPDTGAKFGEPFASALAQRANRVIPCDALDPSTFTLLELDPRTVTKRAEAYLKASGLAHHVIISVELPFKLTYTADEERRIGISESDGESHPALAPILAAATNRLAEMGVTCEMAVDRSRSVGVLRFAGMKAVQAADSIQELKSYIADLATARGLRANFSSAATGSWMYCGQMLWKDGAPKLAVKQREAGQRFADLTEDGAFYIGGLLRHARALNAFANPLASSYERLTLDAGAPVLAAYSERNRYTACQIPFESSTQDRRIELRFPDPAANPYLLIAALVMAGCDGVRNKIYPGSPVEQEPTSGVPAEPAGAPVLATSLREALESLDTDRDFLRVGGVFETALLDAYIALKKNEAAV
ncbi:MAG TPA: TIR domain-containing protein [Hyphomicrobiaceae bacterium]|nr:TIR domain-containing protein [Hyphomicrobiaceae bacterium]